MLLSQVYHRMVKYDLILLTKMTNFTQCMVSQEELFNIQFLKSNEKCFQSFVEGREVVCTLSKYWYLIPFVRRKKRVRESRCLSKESIS